MPCYVLQHYYRLKRIKEYNAHGTTERANNNKYAMKYSVYYEILLLGICG